MDTKRRAILQALASVSFVAPFGASAQNSNRGSNRSSNRGIRIGLVVGHSTAPAYALALGDFIRALTQERMQRRLLARDGGRHELRVFPPVRGTQTAIADLISRGANLVVIVGDARVVNTAGSVCQRAGVPFVSVFAPWELVDFPRDEALGVHIGTSSAQRLKLFIRASESLNTARVATWLRSSGGEAGWQRVWRRAWQLSSNTAERPGAFVTHGFREVTLPNYVGLHPLERDNLWIDILKQARVENLFSTLPVHELAMFLRQARDKQYLPKVVMVGLEGFYPEGAMHFPPAIGQNITACLGWSDRHPFAYSGQLSGDQAMLLARFTNDRQLGWSDMLGFGVAGMEVAVDGLMRATDPLDAGSLADALARTDLATAIGTVRFGGGESRPLVWFASEVAGQIRSTSESSNKYDFAITDTGLSPLVPQTHAPAAYRAAL